MKFHVGDRVVSIVDNPYGNAYIFTGTTGTVCTISRDNKLVGVRWDIDVKGHGCHKQCENGYGWWMAECQLEYFVDGPEDDSWQCSDEDLMAFISQ